jgi:hypothetical protein
MTKFVGDRLLITARILQIVKPEYTPEDFEFARINWWKNIRGSGGFGLTPVGDSRFREAEIEYWDFDDGPVNNSMSAMAYAAAADKKMPAPYYLYFSKRHKYIRIYDSRVAMTIALYGNVSEYLKNLEDRNDRKKA